MASRVRFPQSRRNPHRSNSPRHEQPAATSSLALNLPRPAPIAIASLLVLLLLACTWPSALEMLEYKRSQLWQVDETVVAEAISPYVAVKEYPAQIDLPEPALVRQVFAHYTLDADLQSYTESLLRQYRPDYGVIVALDPDSGKVLAMASETRDQLTHRNLALTGNYPGASIFKIITAAAALNENKANPDTIYPFNGKSTTLYKKHVFSAVRDRWTRDYPFSESFAKSVNPVFGRIGALVLGGEMLLDYAQRYGFNGQFASDFHFENGDIELDPNDQWQVAESAAGFTTRNTLSPLHGATIAASAVNGGYLVAPTLVDSLKDVHGIPLYLQEAPARSRVLTPEAAGELRKMMRETIRIGSAKKKFRGFFKGALADLEVGGKTGTLRGNNPRGLYEWFVGYGQLGNKKIAFAVMCISIDKWYVKPATLARLTLEHYFTRPEPQIFPAAVKTASALSDQAVP